MSELENSPGAGPNQTLGLLVGTDNQDILNESHLIAYYELYRQSSDNHAVKASISLLFIHDRYDVDGDMKKLEQLLQSVCA